MTDERTVDRLVDHLRAHVAELRRLEQEGAEAREVAERKRLIVRLQNRLAYAVRDLLAVQQPSAVGAEVRPRAGRP
jgi:Holliday junction resolvasome RuvABC ATP-dependent DNA helicase subunit